MYLLQGAIFAGMLIFIGWAALTILFSIPLASMFIRTLKKYVFNPLPEALSFKEIMVYLLGSLMGFIIAGILAFILLFLVLFLVDKTGFAFD